MNLSKKYKNAEKHNCRLLHANEGPAPVVNIKLCLSTVLLGGFLLSFLEQFRYVRLSMYQLSIKLQAYIAKVEKETGRQALIQTVKNVGLSGMMARFSEHPTYIFIEVVQTIRHGEQIEHSIAHEATHGLLAYAKGYCQLKPKHTLATLESDSIGILATMIEDIVVNKIIQENDFPPYSSAYLETVKKETKALRKNQDYYHQFKNPFKDRFMVFR